MTESIKFGPEWLRNSVANVSSSNVNTSPSIAAASDSITCRPVLSDHRYGREEMLSLCDKSNRLPDVLTRFRRLYVADWQVPLALLPNTDDDRSLGASTTWGTSHIRPLMPGSGLGRSGTGAIRGGLAERGRGRGRGLYHANAGYIRSTSLYDDEGRRAWLDRNGTESSDWSGSGNSVSPRKEFSRGNSGLENWRKGNREESNTTVQSENDWRSSNNGSNAAREKWARGTSWRDGDVTSVNVEASNSTNDPPLQHQSVSSSSNIASNQVSNTTPSKGAVIFKKSWDEDHLPEWATESFDYGGTFDATGAFHDNDRDQRDNILSSDTQEKKAVSNLSEEKKDEVKVEENCAVNVEAMAPFKKQFEGSEKPQKFMEFMHKNPKQVEGQQNSTNFDQVTHNPVMNGSTQNTSTHIDRMKEVADLVANLIMEDDPKDVKENPSTITPPQQPQQPPQKQQQQSQPQPPHQQQQPPPPPATPVIDWFYLDPQGDTQGPFSAQDMSEWYKAGYFQESLMVRRSIDGGFMTLGQLVNVYGRSGPFIAAGSLMDPIQQQQQSIHPAVEIDPFRVQQQQQRHQHQQRLLQPNDVSDWSMMTPEQQIMLLNMRLSHQRPLSESYVMKPLPHPTGTSPLDIRRMLGNTGAGNDFYQNPVPLPTTQTPALPQDIDPIQQLLMQLQKTGTGGNIEGMANEAQWMKRPGSPKMMMQQPNASNNNNNLELITPTSTINPQLLPNVLNQNVIGQQSNNWNQHVPPLGIWDISKVEAANQSHHQANIRPGLSPSMQNQVVDIPSSQQDNLSNGNNNNNNSNIKMNNSNNNHSDDTTSFDISHGSMTSKFQETKKKKQKDDEKGINEQKRQAKEGVAFVTPTSIAATKQNNNNKKKIVSGDKQQQQQQQHHPQQLQQQQPSSKKEDRSVQPAAPAPWCGHQNIANSTSLAKIQKSEAQRRQGELAALREKEQQLKLEMVQKLEAQKNDSLKWGAAPVARVKTLDEIQAEEQSAAAVQRDREAIAQAKRDAAKKDITTTSSDVSIWNSTPHSMAWHQPKAWSGEQTSGSGFWEEPTKTNLNQLGKSIQMLSKSQTMASITTSTVNNNNNNNNNNNKKHIQQPASTATNTSQLKKNQTATKKSPSGDKKDKKDENNTNEFTSWCMKTLSSMNGNVDVPTFVSFLQDIESPFEVKDYIKMYLGETKECSEFAKQFLERRSKQRNQQRLQNAHIDDMCSPAPAITPTHGGGVSSDFQEVKAKNKKIKSKKVMKVVDGRILGFTATSSSDRINVGDRDYGDI